MSRELEHCQTCGEFDWPWGTCGCDESTCHCGDPILISRDLNSDGTPFTRGLCAHCDAVRCDAYPGACRGQDDQLAAVAQARMAADDGTRHQLDDVAAELGIDLEPAHEFIDDDAAVQSAQHASRRWRGLLNRLARR